MTICHYSSLASLQTPEDKARSEGKHETVKVLKEYAEVWSVEMQGCMLNLDAFLSHSLIVAISHLLITLSLSTS